MNNLKKFLLTVKAEMIKVSWPTRSELWDATSVVIISTFILAVFVYIIDLLFAASVGLIIK